jgi:hypothetical protein
MRPPRGVRGDIEFSDLGAASLSRQAMVFDPLPNPTQDYASLSMEREGHSPIDKVDRACALLPDSYGPTTATVRRRARQI